MSAPAVLQALADEMVTLRAALRHLEQRLTAVASVVEDLMLQDHTERKP